MSVYTKSGGAWKAVTEIHIKVSGIWKAINNGWVNISGAWKQFYNTFPEDLIAFSTSTSIAGWNKMDGVEASPTLIDRYPKITSSEGSTGGGLTHQHAGYSGSSGGLSKTSRVGSDYLTVNTHTHSISHTHGAVNHEPPYLNILPVTNGDAIKSTMFLFYDGASAPTGWSAEASAIDKFFKGAETPGGGGTQTSHNHSYSGNTGSASASHTNVKQQGSRYRSYVPGSHTHTMSHTHTGGNVYPLWHGLIPVKPDSDTSIIPSGICAFFKGSIIPGGWSYFSTAEGKWIQGKSTAGANSGSNTHSHSTLGASSGYTGSGVSVDPYSNAWSAQSSSGHNHSINHGHDTQNNEPPYQELMFLKKN